METRFDPAKDEANVRAHGISLARAFDMESDLTITGIDTRFDYGEDRFISVGPIDGELFVLAHTYRDDEVRPISLRPATRQERRWYKEAPR